MAVSDLFRPNPGTAIRGPSAIDFYSMLSGIGDTLRDNSDRSAAPGLMAAALRGDRGAQPAPAMPGAPARASEVTSAPLAPPELMPIIERASKESGVPAETITKLLYTESRFKPDALNEKSGAQGIAQFMPATAAERGVNPGDPNSAIPGAAKYFAENTKKFGDNAGLGAAAYNWGPGNVEKWVAAGGDPSKVPAETRAYVQQVTGKPLDQWFGGGRAMPGNATPGAPASEGVSDSAIQRISALSANPYTAKMGQALAEKYLTPQFGFQTLPDGTIVRTNPRTGTVEPIYQSNKPSFTTIGKDQNGNDVHGFVDLSTRTVTPANAKGVVAPGEATNANLTGDEYLKTLDPGRANQVKAIVEGRMSPPGGMSLKSPQIQALMRDAAQYDPGFDMNVWSQRNATTKDFANGKAAQNITSLNTVIGHLDDLRKAADGLGNYNVGIPGVTTFNSVKNAIASSAGSPEVKRYELASKAVADELAKVFRSSGMSDSEIAQWHGALSAGMTPDQQKAVISQALSLLDSRVNALGDQRSRGMAKAIEGRSLLNPKAQKTLGEIEAWAKGEKPAAATEPTAPTKKLGDVQIPIVAARALQSDPTLREQFDAKYGLGASDRVLGPSR